MSAGAEAPSVPEGPAVEKRTFGLSLVLGPDGSAIRFDDEKTILRWET
jgi:hypothetical protein